MYKNIRDMFKALGIIESFGTEIGEAKHSLANNGSPAWYYKEFNCISNVTSVVIPVNKDYESMKNNGNPKIKVGFEVQTQDIKRKILDNSKASEILYCSETTATKYIKRMSEELKIIAKVERAGKGKYEFSL